MELPRNTDRRTVLKTIGTGAVGSAVFAGTVSAGPRTNFAYVPDCHVTDEDNDVTDEAVAILGRNKGRENLNCNDAGANIKTTVWEVSISGGSEDCSDSIETWYTIPNSYRKGETLKITSNAVDCASENYGGLTEVGVTKIE